MTRVVLDTNVLVSALINPSGIPATVLDLILAGEIELICDNRILQEYRAVLMRDKFSFSPNLIKDLLEFIKNEGIFVIAQHQNVAFVDPDDKKFYELAACEAVDHLITGEKKHFPNNRKILSPREFITTFLK